MLTDLVIQGAPAKEKPYLLKDDRGLYIEVRPSGRKFWRLRLWEDGKEKKKSLGEYPKVSLAKARRIRDQVKMYGNENGLGLFGDLADEWLAIKVKGKRTEKTFSTNRSRLNRWVIPRLGQRLTVEITAPEVLKVLREIEAEEKYESAKRVKQMLGQIFRYGVATGQCERDVTADLRGALQGAPVRHMATILDPVGIGGLMRSIDALSGQIRCTLLIQAYTFVRPGELRLAEWNEIDGDTWKIPAARMKMKRVHWVPLSRQSMETLLVLRNISGRSKYLFPSMRSRSRPMSDMTVNAAIRRMGYGQNEMTGHGFRSMFSTIANEHGWPPDVIERQLAHVQRNAVRAAYNHAEYLPQRREMMQWWADWLDGVRG